MWGGAILGLGIQWCGVRIHSRRRLFIASKRDFQWYSVLSPGTWEEDFLGLVNGASVDVKSNVRDTVIYHFNWNYKYVVRRKGVQESFEREMCYHHNLRSWCSNVVILMKYEIKELKNICETCEEDCQISPSWKWFCK